MKTQLFSLKNFALFFLLGFMIILSSCQEEPDLIGMSLQSENERLGIGYSDTTINVIAYSDFDDSLRTDNYSANLLGTFNDPTFGTTTASIFTQIRLSTTSPSFPAGSTLDSLVLYLPYSGSYQIDPAIMDEQVVKVYEVNQKMYIDSIYYSNRVLSSNSTELGNLTFTPKPKDSIMINGEKQAPQLQIKLSSALGNSLLQALPADLANSDKFTEFFKGIYIKALPLNTTQENKGSILYFNLLSTLARMTLYYKKDINDTVSNQYNFVINDKSAKYTYFNHYGYVGNNATRPATIDFQKQLGVGGFVKDTNLGQQKLYLQSMGGVKVNFKFPNIRNFSSNKVVVNEAILVIKNDDGDDKNGPPALLTVLKKLVDGKTAFLPDIFEGSGFFGGTYNTVTREYRMRITRYFQYMLNTTDADYGLVMLIDSRRTTANRFVFKGTDKTLGNRMKIEIKYTVIK